MEKVVHSINLAALNSSTLNKTYGHLNQPSDFLAFDAISLCLISQTIDESELPKCLEVVDAL